MGDVGRKFDDVLRNLAGQAGSLEALLAVFFSFLHRNTDFYVTFDPAKTAKAGMGFPVGKSEELLLRAFRSFPYKPYGGGGGGGTHEEQRPASGGEGSPTATVPSSGLTSRKKKTQSPAVGGTTAAAGLRGPAPASKATAPSSTPGEETAALSSSTTPPFSPKIIAAATTCNANPAVADGIRVRYTKDGKQVPIGNGGVTPWYHWTQTVNEATVYVDVPPGTRAKDVSCVIQPRWLKLRVRGAGAEGPAVATAAAGGAGEIAMVAEAGVAQRLRSKRREEDDAGVIFDGQVPSTVSREGSMWSLNDGKTVVISFEKTTKSWWKSVVEGDPEIDTSMVDSTTKISEYDGETQGAIRKIMFDQRQKSLGLPTSDQLNTDALLERAKGLPGSPFLPGGMHFEGDGAGGDGDGLTPDGGGREPPEPPM